MNMGVSGHFPDLGPQEKSMKKSCVSFETECSIFTLVRAGSQSNSRG